LFKEEIELDFVECRLHEFVLLFLRDASKRACMYICR
jgi:hypothetical protein